LTILDYDEFMRPTTDMQSLGALKPSFKEQGEVMPGFDAIALMKYPHLERINHIHHAGNSSGIVDGAAARFCWAIKNLANAGGLKPRARHCVQPPKLGPTPPSC
jgi:acetyl-CoA C-acetyltransferase